MDIIRRWRWVDVKGRRMFARVSDYVSRRSVEIRPRNCRFANIYAFRIFPRISRTRVSVSDFVKAFSRDITGNCGHYLPLAAWVVGLRHEMHEFCGEFDSLYTQSVRGCGPRSVHVHPVAHKWRKNSVDHGVCTLCLPRDYIN